MSPAGQIAEEHRRAPRVEVAAPPPEAARAARQVAPPPPGAPDPAAYHPAHPMSPFSRFLRILFPMPHFMGLAPLDAWARLLFSPLVFVKPAYWPRLLLGVLTSVVGTAITLPERLVLAPVLAVLGRRSGHRLRHDAGVLIVLGYPRSGTTHLHYLFACDPRFWTPRWYQALAPAGFVLSWALLRVLLVPFLSNKRLMDDMAFGPEWPAEDEFAVNNWCAASYLPGRLVVPQLHEHYHRFHDLEGLSTREHSRWRRYSWAFAWKLSRIAGRCAILLKSPSHTARVKELVDLYAGNVRFVHIVRDPRAVVRSNVSMLQRAEVYHLQDAVADDDLERGLIDDLVSTDAKFRREAAELPPGRLAEVRYQDLVADPVGQMRRIYREVGLDFTPEVEARLVRYLHTVADYKAATPAGKAAGVRQGAAVLDDLARRSGLDRPTVEKRALPPLLDRPSTQPRGWPALVGASVAIAVLWLILAYITKNRMDWAVWPAGAALGYVAVRAARRGSALLGTAAAIATLVLFLAAAWPATWFAHYLSQNPHPFRVQLPHIWLSTKRGILAENNIAYLLLGVITAYRFASREHVLPPGSA